MSETFIGEDYTDEDVTTNGDFPIHEHEVYLTRLETEGRELNLGSERPHNLPVLEEGEELMGIFEGFGEKVERFRINSLQLLHDLWDYFAKIPSINPPKFVAVKKTPYRGEDYTDEDVTTNDDFPERSYEPFQPKGEIKGKKLPRAQVRPYMFPYLRDGEKLVAIFDHGMGVKIRYFTVNSVEGMKELWDEYAAGWAFEPPEFVIVKEETL